jgi:hypothetical protein
VIDNLPDSSFADGAGDCDNLKIHQSAIFRGEFAKGFDCIIDLQQAKARGINIPADDGANGTFGKGIINIVVTVEILPYDGEETIACPDSSGIGTYPYERAVTSSPENSGRITRGASSYYTGKVFN